LCFGFLKAVNSKVSNVKLSYAQKMFYLNYGNGFNVTTGNLTCIVNYFCMVSI
jgi:hypothetical protein